MTPAGVDLWREVAAALVVGAAFLAVFGLAELWKRLGDPPVEWTRKLVHFGGGLVAATFPWAFRSPWTVVALAVAFGGIIWGTRRLGLLGSVHGVARESEGGLWYPLAVLLVFLLARDQPTFYLISILVLVVADAAAALVGSTYGRQMYEVETDRRSLEGSVVFLLTTFLLAHIPLLLMADLDPLKSVLIAVQVAIIVTQFEAISLRGNDNILVPLATYFLLMKMTPRSADHIADQLVAQLAIIAVLGIAAWRTRSLTFSGAMALMLFMYGLWSLGGPEWLVAPALAFGAFLALQGVRGRGRPPPGARYQVVAIFYVCIVATALFLANNAIETLIPGIPDTLRFADPLYAPFIAAIAAQLALVAVAQIERFRVSARAWTIREAGAALAALILVVPSGLAVGPHGLTLWGAVLAVLATAFAIIFYVVGRGIPTWPHEPPWNVRLQALSVAIATAVTLPLHLWQVGFSG